MTDPAPALTLEIWSDVVCSWCYVGKRYLEQALEEVPDRELIDLRWRSFELDPTLPAEAGSADEELARRRGISLEQARTMHEETERMGAEMGLTFDFARARRGNTFDAHRVLHMAHAAGVQNAVQDRLMSAYFGEGSRSETRRRWQRRPAAGARPGGRESDAGWRRLRDGRPHRRDATRSSWASARCRSSSSTAATGWSVPTRPRRSSRRSSAPAAAIR